MSLIHQCKSNEVAFVLFDNEERGLLGSKALNKKYSDLLKNKMVINFDCIGVMACKMKHNIYYTGKIHTNKDTEAYIENIDFLVNSMKQFIHSIS